MGLMKTVIVPDAATMDESIWDEGESVGAVSNDKPSALTKMARANKAARAASPGGFAPAKSIGGFRQPTAVQQAAPVAQPVKPVPAQQDSWKPARRVLPISFESLVPKRQGDHTIYYYPFSQNDRRPVFVDKGEAIEMSRAMPSDNEIIMMLEAADVKYGKFEVYGQDEFKARVAQLAGRYGFNITNPELAHIVQAEAAKMAASAEAPEAAPAMAG